MKENKIRKFNFLIKLGIALSILFAIFLLAQGNSNVVLATDEQEQDHCYLSDIEYESTSSVGWGSITYDRNLDSNVNNGLINLIVNGEKKKFFKGISAHATSTLIYDISEYNYDYFTAYLGVDAGRGNNGDGVQFEISTSTDGENWDLKTPTSYPIMKGDTEARFEKIDIKGAKYLKLYASQRRNNTADHAVYADAMLIKEGYEPGEVTTVDFIKTTQEYDEIIKGYAGQEITGDYEKTLLQREFVNDVGYDTLQFLIGYKQIYKEVIEWLLNDTENLRQYTIGNPPDGGNYYDSLTILARLYEEYSDDFENTELLGNPTYPEMTYGDLYKKMAMSIALTHTQRVGLWMNSSLVENQSEPLRRYAIFKYLHKNGGMRISETMDMTHIFEDLHVAEMRLVLYNNIDDEEILWLNRYTQDNIDANPNNVWRYQTPHPYIAYVWPNYANPVYFENEEYFNELFAVKKTDNNEGTELLDKDGNATGKIGIFDSEFVIPGGKNVTEYRIKVTKPKTTVTTEEGTTEKKTYKLWMNFRNKFGTGCVCGGISKSGANIRGSHGIPAMVVGQPGHAALMFYSKDAEGRGFWRIDNDVSGWTLSGGGGRLLGWGSGSYAYGFSNGVYVELEQAAINDYENLIKAEEQVFLAKVYKDDLAKQEELYENALSIQSINFDAWLGLIDVYKANVSKTEGDGGKTEDDFYNLAERIAEKLKYYPLPMYNATNLIKPRLTSIENSYRFTLLQTRILTEASTLPNNTADRFTVVQPGVTRVEANYLLGKLDKTIATFSFDGADAGKIVLADRFTGNGVRWEYCINGQTRNESNANSRGDGWEVISSPAEEGQHKVQLTPQQIESITAENDIYIHIVGVNYDEKNLYKIDITEQTNLANLYNNDLENRMIGVNLNTQWRYNETDAWTSYSVASPDLTGDKQVQVRQAATGTMLASQATDFYRFTEDDDQQGKRKYIPVSHLSIHGVSTEATSNAGAAANAIDGNYWTRWHSAWNGSDTQRYITIKLDSPVYLSAVEFVPAGGGNGKIYDGTIKGSMDGTTWTTLSQKTGLTYTNQANTNEDAKANTKSFDIENPQEVQYVQIIADRTNGNWFTAREFNLFEDLTKKPVSTVPTAQIAYSTTEPTKGPVIARLVNPSTPITITNNNGQDTYVFTENNKPFTFEFEDANGNKGTATANVTWIDKDEPTADVDFKLDADKKLLILLENISEDVYLLDENNNKINYIEIDESDANKRVTNITYLDESGNAYKILDKDENGKTTKITYKNTTGSVSNVATYVTTLKTEDDGKDTPKIGDVIKEEYFDNEGNPVTVTDAEEEELRNLQQTARSNPLEYVIEQNGDYEFKMLDKANNLLYKSIKVDYIDNDNKILVNDITYNTTNKTKDDVIATIKPSVINSKGGRTEAQVISDGGKTHTFTKENEEFVFRYKDPADTESLEVKEHTAKVDWIDKTAPTAQLEYSPKTDTSKATVTLVNESETIIITNNGGSREYTFTGNDEFTFEFQDEAGNKGTVTATVDWLASGVIFTSDVYKIEPGYVSRIAPQTTVSKFKENVIVKPSQELTFLDKDGNTIGDNDIVTTESSVKVGNKTYTLCVTGDVNRNGRIDMADLTRLRADLYEGDKLQGIDKLCMDLDGNGKITTADLTLLRGVLYEGKTL